MSTCTMVKEIRKVTGGYIVEARWPYGPDPGGYGEVVCTTFKEVVDLLKKTDPDRKE